MLKYLMIPIIVMSLSETISAQHSESDTTGSKSTVHQEYKDPVVSFLLSTVIPVPGAGQIYNGDYGKAVAEIIAFGAGILCFATLTIKFGSSDVSPQAVAGVVLIGGSKLHSMIDAPLSSIEHNKRTSENSKTERKGE